METTMFTLGVLTMIMVMLITVVVVGIVKVFKLKEEVTNIQNYISNLERDIDNRSLNLEQIVESQITNVYTHVSDLENMLSNSMREERDFLYKESASYTDKRIDKLIDTYFAAKEAEQLNKKLIKG